jgi:threonyl-tRNA synthetase
MGQDGTENHRPVMLHRVIYGSLERFIGILIEHFAGNLPLWLSPYQTRVITVGENYNDYAALVNKSLFDAGIRSELDDSANTVSKKILEAQMDKVNYMIVIGEKEESSTTLSVRYRDGKEIHGVKIEDFLKQLNDEIDEKVIVLKQHLVK